MTDDAIRGMRRAYSADVTVIDDAVGRIVAALDGRGLLDDTWIVYTSDHGEMGGNHGMMSKCVLYEPAVRVPLIIRPPGGCAPRVVDALVEHLDVPATLRDIAPAPALPASEGRSLRGYVDGAPTHRPRARVDQRELGLRVVRRPSATSSSSTRTPSRRASSSTSPTDPDEDDNRVGEPECKAVVDELMDTHVRPFLTTAPARPHRSPFTG